MDIDIDMSSVSLACSCSIGISIGDKIASGDARKQDDFKQRDICSIGSSFITTIAIALGFENNTSFDKQLGIDWSISNVVMH